MIDELGERACDAGNGALGRGVPQGTRPIEREDEMTLFPWHAYFYDSLSQAEAPARTAIIEAGDDAEASELARAQMGQCVRVELARPVWATPGRIIVADRSREARRLH